MSIVLMPIPKQQFFGANGSPLAGGKVYTYAVGTTTPKATYTDSTGAVENANPVVLDSAGRASIWLNGYYKIALYDSNDVLQYSIDNVSALSHTDLDTVTATQTLLLAMKYGYVQRSVFGVTDTDTITIGPGVYHHSGTTDQFVYWNSTLSKDVTVTGTQWYYLYIDDSAIVSAATNVLTASEFTLVTTAPTWSAAKHGWYNGSDRCIMAFYVTSGSLDDISHDGGDMIGYSVIKNDRESSDIEDAETVSLNIPSFSKRALCTFHLASNGNYLLSVRRDATASGMGVVFGIAATSVRARADVVTTSSQTIYVTLSDYSGTNTLRIYTSGWYFPTGM